MTTTPKRNLAGLLKVVASICLVVAAFYVIKGLEAAQTAVRVLGNGANQAAQQIQQQIDQQGQQAAQAAASRPPQDSACSYAPGQTGIVVWHSFDSGYDCVAQ